MIQTVEQLKAVLEAMDGSHFDWHYRTYRHNFGGNKDFFCVYGKTEVLTHLYGLMDWTLHAILWKAGKDDNDTATIMIPVHNK